MRHPGGHRTSLLSGERKTSAIDFEGRAAGQNEEELMSLLMVVADFPTPGRHPLLDDAKPRRLQEMPAVAVAAPDVVLGVLLADNIRHAWLLCYRLTPAISGPRPLTKLQPDSGIAGPLHRVVMASTIYSDDSHLKGE
jgi:hypothetical protein